ncbi:MAG: type II toxin-antitoxin system RelE/ParE family toxin [Candidatus Delongbacteria bacterium]
MAYTVEIMSKALKDLKKIDRSKISEVINKIQNLENGLEGDVKKLTNFTPEYRLRVGKYRVLFEIEGDKIVIYRIKHRKDAYT